MGGWRQPQQPPSTRRPIAAVAAAAAAPHRMQRFPDVPRLTARQEEVSGCCRQWRLCGGVHGWCCLRGKQLPLSPAHRLFIRRLSPAASPCGRACHCHCRCCTALPPPALCPAGAAGGERPCKRPAAAPGVGLGAGRRPGESLFVVLLLCCFGSQLRRGSSRDRAVPFGERVLLSSHRQRPSPAVLRYCTLRACVFISFISSPSGAPPPNAQLLHNWNQLHMRTAFEDHPVGLHGWLLADQGGDPLSLASFTNGQGSD